jgi:protein O-GlcNAc transferase
VAAKPPASQIQAAFAKANALRTAGQWKEAIQAYNGLTQALPNSPEIAHNLSICWLGAGKADIAARYAQQALSQNPGLWQSQLILAKAQRQLDPSGQACEQLLTQLAKHSANHQAKAHARLELSELSLNVFCNARQSHEWAAPLARTPEFEERAKLNCLIAQLYERDLSDLAFTRQAIAYSEKFLDLSKPHTLAKKAPKKRSKKAARLRVGLVSSMFSASPLYYLCFAAFEALAKDCELIVFNRGKKHDWASQHFHDIASEWIDCQMDTGLALAQRMNEAGLDILFELSGWMDTDALKAASLAPAPRLYKWVGGQAMTTGLKVFNGYLSDTWQSPAATRTLFTEPLICLPQGYVRYQPPDYFPKRRARKTANTAAIIGNPLKVTKATVKHLLAANTAQTQDFPAIKELRLIDKRYRYSRVRERVEALLEGFGGTLKVVACESHEEFLKEVAKVPWVIDTAPYSAGLTAREALALGAQLICPPTPGKLFSSRHGWAAQEAYRNAASQGSTGTLQPIDLTALWAK